MKAPESPAPLDPELPELPLEPELPPEPLSEPELPLDVEPPLVPKLLPEPELALGPEVPLEPPVNEREPEAVPESPPWSRRSKNPKMSRSSPSRRR